MPNSQKMELWWELSYAQYLTIPRSVIQEMSIEWQDKFAKLLEELDDTIDWRPEDTTYYCMLRDNETGRFRTDAIREYRHNPEVQRIVKGLFYSNKEE